VPWTKDDLKEIFNEKVGGHKFILVSNREPYIHVYVAKESVASRYDERGVLVLSKFTGSARELENAVLVNPIATDQFADALKAALEMAPDEQAARMKKLRETVRENNVYRWAGNIVREMKNLMYPPVFEER
jgi:trehalose-6-phosphate synthase